jgi:hypothetical protein
MTTVIDPLGTPTVVYNRSGVNIQSVTANGAGSTSPSGSAPVLNTVSGYNVILVTVPDASNVDVVLPSNSDIGDVFELHNVSTAAAIQVWPSGSMTLASLATSSPFTVSPATAPGFARYGTVFRMVSATMWAIL